MAIRAPFNFVPVSDKVYFPDWADQINHDIPFSDGISGSIILRIKAESPVFVRNGHTAKDKEENNKEYILFSNIGSKYFLPGTTVKGAVRNILEIMSFGKMQLIDNKRYGIRDLQLSDYKKIFQENEVHCGWMRKENDTIIIEDHGIPYRVSHEEIDRYFCTQFCEAFKNKDFFKNESNKSPIYKYNAIKSQTLDLHFDIDKTQRSTVDKRKFVVIKKSGSLNGKIVFTGQPSERKEKYIDKYGKPKKASGKFYEFIFSEKCISKYELDYYDKNGKFADFLFIHKDSQEWSYWKQSLNSGMKVPVFLIAKDNVLLHFGLSYLYKLPFEKRIKGYLPELHNDTKLDLAECIFGTSSNEHLKGRVSFSNAFAVNAKEMNQMEVYMGSPKPTYYPIYLKQNGENGYLSDRSSGFSTMLNSSAQIKGWKRYHLRDSYEVEFETPKGQEDNVNKFVPLDAGSEFTCRVRFSNLRKTELGALIKSIETPNSSFLNIGFAKAFGFGKVKIDIESILPVVPKEECVNSFNQLMSDNIINYSKQIQITELNLLRRVNNLSTRLEYMELDEFVECKRHYPRRQIFGQYLKNTSDYLRPVEQKKIEVLSKAVVTVVSGNVTQARLTEGKDQNNKNLVIPLNSKRPKRGEVIEVKIIYKGGNVDKLELLKSN